MAIGSLIGGLAAISKQLKLKKKKKKKKGFNSLKSGTAAEKKAYKKGMSGKSVNLKTGKVMKGKPKKKGTPKKPFKPPVISPIFKKGSGGKKKPTLGKIKKAALQKKKKKLTKYRKPTK